MGLKSGYIALTSEGHTLYTSLCYAYSSKSGKRTRGERLNAAHCTFETLHYIYPTIYLPLNGDPFPGVHPNDPPVPGPKPTGLLTGVVGPEAASTPTASPGMVGVSVL